VSRLPDGRDDLPPVSRLPDPETFLSGEHGEVGGKRGALRRAADRALDAWLLASGTLRRIDALAARTPHRDVLVLGIYSPPGPLIEAQRAHLASERHSVRIQLGSRADYHGGKFENLNALLENAGAGSPDWTIVVDDDVELPPCFLDRFVAVCERFDLQLAQPAQTLASHAAWRIVRRRPGSLVRETRFVEIGPVTAFRREAAAELLPFPPLRYGWGLDLAWGAIARERGWRTGIVDVLPVRHERAPVAASYSSDEAIDEAQRFLADRAYITSKEAQETLTTHRRLPR
jgi:hypothetical protein